VIRPGALLATAEYAASTPNQPMRKYHAIPLRNRMTRESGE